MLKDPLPDILQTRIPGGAEDPAGDIACLISAGEYAFVTRSEGPADSVAF